MVRTSQIISFCKVFVFSALIVLLIMPLSAVIKANAGSATVFIDPTSQQVRTIGDSFTVNVSIADVSNLYGYQFELYYDSVVMNESQVTEGSFISGSNALFGASSYPYNSTYDFLFIYCTLEAPVSSGVSGGGVLATIKFKSLASGNSVPLHLTDVELSDPNSSPISYESSDGAVTVVPEFTSLFAVLTLLIASLFGIFVGKRAMRKSGISNRTNVGANLAYKPSLLFRD